MKRLRSSDDLDSYGEKSVVKDWVRREEDSGSHRPSPSVHRSSYYKSSDSGGRKVLSSSGSRYERLNDDKESSRLVRKRPDYDPEGYDRRKGYDRHREVNERGISSSSPRAGYGTDRMYRSESFSGPKRDFPKGFRSDRDRSRREGSVTSWRRFGGGKDGEDGARSGSEVGRGNRLEADDVGKAKSPQSFRDAKSPAWSKDSGSEQSKSVEVKKHEDMPVESNGPGSEREEGELEPDPQPHLPSKEPVEKEKATVKLKLTRKKLNVEDHVDDKVQQDRACIPSLERGDVRRVGNSEEQAGGGQSNVVQDVRDENKNLPDCQDTSVQESGGGAVEEKRTEQNDAGKNVLEDTGEGRFVEEAEGTFDDNLLMLQDQKEEKNVLLDMKSHDANTTENLGTSNRTEMPSTDEAIQTWKDKGKSVAVVPSTGVHFAETILRDEDKRIDLATSGDVEDEGPSTRAFQFFSSDPIKKQEKVDQSTPHKPNDDKLALELSLSLPNVLLPIGAQHRGEAPGSPTQTRSIQSFPSSFRTYSDGFTASMSFSGSQQFTHNPSCSLTHNGYDFEQSVGSKPLFQGVDWKALASDENKNVEFPAYQGTSSRGTNFRQEIHVSQGNSSGQAAVQHLRVTGGSSKQQVGIENQLSFNKHSSGIQHVGSYENGLEICKDRRQVSTEKDSSGLRRSNGPDQKERVSVVGADFAESIVTMIDSEPLHIMAQRFKDMSEQQMTCVKEFLNDIITNPSKKWQLSALQKALLKRSDVTLDMLLNAPRIQLEIFVALKTGLREFLLQKYELKTSDLAEIYLNMRCKNLSCRSLLPVDECDCKICAQRDGFCRECMCLVCSKFDTASNTCSWVGCDVCLHWCHADCGLRQSHIRNGPSAKGVQGSTEMQFHCVACDHPSEMFGFVKEVFQNFVKEWTEENLTRELEYVRRIFCASKDARGKQLHEIAIRKLGKRADLQEVKNHIMSFFTEAESAEPGNFSVEPKRELPTQNQEKSNGIIGSSQGTGWLTSAYPGKAKPLENSISLLPAFESSRNDEKYTMDMDLRTYTHKEPIFDDELDSIVRIKLAEAKMFQARADDARREAEALKRISVTKSERIEEEYHTRISKLRLSEAEEMRKQKVEELQTHERAHHEYFNIKMRMETDIKDLLLKMEATRRNLSG